MTTKEATERAKRLWNSGLLTDAEYQREEVRRLMAECQIRFVSDTVLGLRTNDGWMVTIRGVGA